ncbi:MAG: MBOAT family O-acyltransferase [Bacilli bacterium]
MVFSSIPFLFFFFPLFLLLYLIVNDKFKNIILLIFSLIFYAWGEPVYILLMIFSSWFSFYCGKKIDETKEKKKYLLISIIANLGILGFFKYADFLIGSFNSLLNINIPLLRIGLPIGISFFTFQIMSYTIDIYRKEVKAEKSFLIFLTYVSMFPQLIAGPIVRYETVSKELHKRNTNFKKFSDGFLRFLRGLFKKVLIANNIGYLFTLITSIPNNEISVLSSWLAIIAFSFQIYFDFSGYSDMAIGMGRMLGFTFLENFNFPYIATSITDFWRRWHISLSSFFRDYLYIPLGGSRVSKLLNIRNILIVWILTGLWHGAAWNFILWGLYYGVILLIEKFVLNKVIEKFPNWLKHTYTLFLILIGWTLFAFSDMTSLTLFFKNLFGLNDIPFIDKTFIYYFFNYLPILIVSVIASIPLNLDKYKINYKLVSIIYIVLFIISISYLVADSYNPFLYFRF